MSTPHLSKHVAHFFGQVPYKIVCRVLQKAVHGRQVVVLHWRAICKLPGRFEHLRPQPVGSGCVGVAEYTPRSGQVRLGTTFPCKIWTCRLWTSLAYLGRWALVA